MDINAFAEACHDNAVKHGFRDIGRERAFPEDIALIHSEISESLEHYRDGVPLEQSFFLNNNSQKPDGIWIELGDAVIRIFETMVHYGQNPEEILRTKHNYNLTRPYRHGGKVI